jgi:hypothetical protein
VACHGVLHLPPKILLSPLLAVYIAAVFAVLKNMD